MGLMPPSVPPPSQATLAAGLRASVAEIVGKLKGKSRSTVDGILRVGRRLRLALGLSADRLAAMGSQVPRTVVAFIRARNAVTPIGVLAHFCAGVYAYDFILWRGSHAVSAATGHELIPPGLLGVPLLAVSATMLLTLLIRREVWRALFVGLTAPAIVASLGMISSIINTVWLIILGAAAGLCVYFDGFATLGKSVLSLEGGGVPEASRAAFGNGLLDTCKFWLERISTAFLQLGAVLGVTMTILWSAPRANFDLEKADRSILAATEVFSYFWAGTLFFVWMFEPLVTYQRRIVEALGASRGTTADASATFRQR